MNPDAFSYYCDASIDPYGRSSGVAVVVRNAAGQILDATSCCLEGMTNNEAEYEALILGMELALARADPYQRVTLLSDSRVVIGQLSGQYAVRDFKLAHCHKRAARLLQRLPGITVAFVPREHNRVADALAAEAMEAGRERVRGWRYERARAE